MDAKKGRILVDMFGVMSDPTTKLDDKDKETSRDYTEEEKAVIDYLVELLKQAYRDAETDSADL